MKKILSLLLIICICFFVVGCNKVADTNSSSLSSTSTETVIFEEESSTNNTTGETTSDLIDTSNSTPVSSANSNNSSTISSVTNEDEDISNIDNSHYHYFSLATCTSPSKCSCGKTIGTVSEHTWEEATCQKPKTCKYCRKTEGGTVDHIFDYDEYLGEGIMCRWCHRREYTFESTYMDMVDSSAKVITDEYSSRYLGYRLIITSQNELYKFCQDKKFSNGSHFMKIESDLKFLKFILDGSTYTDNNRASAYTYLVTVDDQLYWFNGKTEKLEKRKPFDIPYNKNYKYIFNAAPINQFKKNVYIDENRYLKCEKNNVISPDGEILYSFPQDETITLALDGIIKTTKGYYTVHYSESYEKEFADSENILKKELKIKYVEHSASYKFLNHNFSSNGIFSYEYS